MRCGTLSTPRGFLRHLRDRLAFFDHTDLDRMILETSLAKDLNFLDVVELAKAIIG